MQGRPYLLEAHPRSRGENVTTALKPAAEKGSSPLTRGKREVIELEDMAGRLIPAHAGKTWCLTARSAWRTAHPRSRGENLPITVATAPSRGSSPLTRGKPVTAQTSIWRTGLIPAHAGKTRGRVGRSRRARAHPRSRGENDRAVTPSMRRLGSSPLTRGKHLRGLGDPARRGLIPAHAGKTLPDLRFYCADRSDLGNP